MNNKKWTELVQKNEAKIHDGLTDLFSRASTGKKGVEYALFMDAKGGLFSRMYATPGFIPECDHLMVDRIMGFDFTDGMEFSDDWTDHDEVLTDQEEAKFRAYCEEHNIPFSPHYLPDWSEPIAERWLAYMHEIYLGEHAGSYAEEQIRSILFDLREPINYAYLGDELKLYWVGKQWILENNSGVGGTYWLNCHDSAYENGITNEEDLAELSKLDDQISNIIKGTGDIITVDDITGAEAEELAREWGWK